MNLATQRGFTLLEMVCVLAIIALLAAVLLPFIPHQTSRSRLQAYALQTATLLKADRNAAIERSSRPTAASAMRSGVSTVSATSTRSSFFTADILAMRSLIFGGGYHVRVDVAKAVDAWPNARSTGALGPSRRIADLLVQRLTEAGVERRDPVVMAAAGSSRLEAAADARAQARLLAEAGLLLAPFAGRVEHWLAPAAVVVVERSSRSPEPTWPAGLRRFRRRDHGETTLWFAEPDDTMEA